MTQTGLFSISEFARYSRTTRDTLLHYDSIGLLSPRARGDNNYRYYSSRQLAGVNLIRTMQGLGMTLTEITDLKDNRTPEIVEKLFEQQIEKIDERIDNWIRARKLLFTLKKSIESTIDVDEKEISIKFLPAEAIVLGDLNDYSRGRDDYDALLSFYQGINRKYPDIDMNYPVWGFFSEERVKKGDWVWPDRFYLNYPEGHDRKPAALYAIGYTRGGYGQNGALYERMLAHIDRNGFEICGDAFEEYPLNEVCVSDPDNYLIRLMIVVREKR
ncbi:MAG: MerR family transcriptional regulator [Clostridiales bacterium]|nr:MerR family transcriptional regulator [Clostridiales bacterium]